MKNTYPEIKNITEVSASIVSNYASYLESEGYSRNTYNKHITFMKSFYKIMMEEEHAEQNPFDRIKRKKMITNSRKELTVEQIFNLLSTATGELALLLGLGYFTGLRRGDCCTLTWEDVDLARGIITRIPNKIRNRSSNPETVKIGICKHLYNALSQIPPEKREGFVLPQMADYYLNNKRDRINRMVKNHFESLGFSTVQEGTGEGTGKRAVIRYGFHSLRYSYISHHAEAGTPQAIIQANAGHANPAMTEHYTKISDEAALRVAGALDLPSQEVVTPKEPVAIDILEIKKLVDSMDPNNWESIKNSLLTQLLVALT